MSAHESSDEWNERQAKWMEFVQPERTPCNLTSEAERLRYRLDLNEKFRRLGEEAAIEVINDLLRLIKPINDHDHREYGCDWCSTQRRAVSFIMFLRRGWDAKR